MQLVSQTQSPLRQVSTESVAAYAVKPMRNDFQRMTENNNNQQHWNHFKTAQLPFPPNTHPAFGKSKNECSDPQRNIHVW